MKGLLGFLLIGILLTGCASPGERMMEPVTFYYPCTVDSDSAAGSVIASEQREASGHRDDLEYLLALYLMGPSDESLRLSVPEGTKVVAVAETGVGLTIELTDEDFTDIQFSLTCACFTMTCGAVKEFEWVTVTSGQRTLTMSKDDIILIDNSVISTTEEAK